MNDELAQFKILGTSGIQGLHYNGDEYQIVFRISDLCNYNCSYCHWKYGKNYKYEDIIKTIDLLYDSIDSKYVRYYFHGGEPTVHPRCNDIMHYIFLKYGDRVIIELQTNLSKPISYFEKLHDEYLNYKLEVSASYHPSQVKNFSEFKNKLDLLHLHNLLGKVDVMLEYEGVDSDTLLLQCDEILKEDYAKRIEFVYSYIDYESSNINTKYQHYVNNHSQFNSLYELTLHNGIQHTFDTNAMFKNQIGFKGWTCDAGKKYIIVNGNGDYYYCSTNTLELPSGNIIKNPSLFAFKTRNCIKCKWDVCKGEFYLNKTKK